MTIRLPGFLIVIALLTCPSSARAAEPVLRELPPVKLDQAVDVALQNNNQVKNGKLEIEISKDRINVARTHMLPAVHISGLGFQLLTPLQFGFDKGAFGTFKDTGPIPAKRTNVGTDQRPALFVNVAVAQPLLQLGRISLAVKQSELARLIAQEKLRLQRQQIIGQVRNAYYKVLEYEDTKKAMESTVTLYAEVDRITSEFLANKTVLPADSLEVKQQLANARYEALHLKNCLASQKEELNHLLGKDVQSSIEVMPVDAPNFVIADLPLSQSRALAARAELRQSTFQARQINLERRSKTLEYLPDLSLVLDYFSVYGTQVIPKNVVALGLFLNWQPIDWGRRRSEIAAQRKLLEQANNNTREQESQIIMELNAAHRKVEESLQFMSVAALGRELCVERLRVVTNKYKEQALLLKDVLTAQRDLTQADNKYTQAVLALWSARADYARAMGED